MTCAAEFPGYKECEKIDACEVSAFTNIMLDPANPTGIILDTSWDTIKLDLKSIVKAGETITHLELAPEGSPTVIRYMREDGTYDCITGDELSRIVSMQLLKDVDQTTPPSDGSVYIYNGQTNMFEPYDLKTFITNINTTVGRLQTVINDLQGQITTVGRRLTDIESLIYNYPQDKTTKIPRANINLISDPTNTDDRTYGIFSHDTSIDQFADEYFA